MPPPRISRTKDVSSLVNPEVQVGFCKVRRDTRLFRYGDFPQDSLRASHAERDTCDLRVNSTLRSYNTHIAFILVTIN